MKIIFCRPDGGVSVVVPIASISSVMARLPASAINPQIVDDLVVPTDRTFRNAWRQSGASINQDMPTCRNLWRDRMRELRKPKLEALDIQWMRAVARNDTVQAVMLEQEREVLRNVTVDPAIDAATTPEQLKVVIPDALR